MYVIHKKLDIDPEILQKQRNRARFRFRAIARAVINNLHWMEEIAEPYEGDNVQRRVEQVMKSKKKQLLSVADKALLNKPAKDRTDVEKKYIYRVIGGLKCFKRYPDHVKKKLAAVTYFRYYGPNRVVVRENQDAEALYFVVTGEVSVSKLIFDPITKKHNQVEVFVMKPGDMFGEVSLLHDIPRTATCTTQDHCEFLALMTGDFKKVLKGSLQKQWDKVRLAMKSFSYFDGLDDVSRRDGCIVAKLKSYEPDETILGDGVEVPNFVYFVLSGTCQMIESLNIETIHGECRTTYKLHDDYESPNESQQKLNEKYFGKKKDAAAAETLDTAGQQTTTKIEKNTIKSDLKTIGQEHESLELQPDKKLEGSENIKFLLTTDSHKTFEINQTTEANVNRSVVDDAESAFSINSKNLKQMLESSSKLKIPTIKQTSFSEKVEIAENVVSETHSQQPPTYDTHFMQVCILKWGATFNLGENMRDRRIIAKTKVDCMLLPKMWLMQHNRANVWSRVLHYLEKKVPTKQDLFKEFVKQRRWLEYRDKVVKDVVRRTNVVNFTTIHDVPYSIRMNEMIDI